MSPASETPSCLRGALRGGAALVRVIGRATFKQAPALKQFAACALERKCPCNILDLKDCSGMDSTFMGVIAGVAMRARRQQAGQVAVLNLSPKTSSLLETLGVSKLAPSYLAGQEPEALRQAHGEFDETTLLDTDTKLTPSGVETVLEAHQDLVRADPCNKQRFEDVIEFLQKEVRPEGRAD
jgi:anti-anti-sigma factor